MYFGYSPTFRGNISVPSSLSKCKPSYNPAEVGVKLSLLFYPEDGGAVLLSDAGPSPKYSALQPRRSVVSLVHRLEKLAPSRKRVLSKKKRMILSTELGVTVILNTELRVTVIWI
jgi:hypothetical protein